MPSPSLPAHLAPTLSDPVSISRKESIVQAIAPLIWIPQAACLALVAGGLAEQSLTNEALIGLVGGFLLLGILRTVIDNWVNLHNIKRAARSVSLARRQAIEQVGRVSPFDIERPAAGGFASAITEQASAILPYQSRFLPARAKSMWVPLAILIAVTPVSWAVGLILLLSAPLIPLFMALVGWKAKSVSQAQLVELYDMNAFMLDRLRGMQTIRALGAVERTGQTILTRAHNLRQRIMAVLRVAFLSSAVLELFSALGVALVAVYVGFHLLGDLNFGAWTHKMSLAEALFVLMLSPAFYEPLRELASAWHDRANGQAAQQQLDIISHKGKHLLGASSEQPENHTDKKTATSNARIVQPAVSLRHISFGYDSDKSPCSDRLTKSNQAGTTVFKDLSLEVRAGEHVAIMAPSGYGKSTLLGLIAGLIRPNSGDVLIGSTRLAENNAASLRRSMAWIGQKPHIFRASVARNITLGRLFESDQLERTLSDAALLDFIDSRGTAELAEGGAGMSGGELVRLSIARALADNQATLLLVDEPTAHLDSETAQDVIKRLFSVANGRTMIIVTHDPAVALHADRTIHLDALPDDPALLEGGSESSIPDGAVC